MQSRPPPEWEVLAEPIVLAKRRCDGLCVHVATGRAKPATYKKSALEFMTPPNPTQLATLKSRGKLIVGHGTADPVFPL